VRNYPSYYNHYTEDQFAADGYFRQWVLFAEADSNEFWNNYLQINPHQQQAILMARVKVEASLSKYSMQPLTEEEKLILKQTIYQRINQPALSFTVLRKKSLQLLQAAAIVSGIIIMTAYFFNKKPEEKTLIVQRTGDKETKEIWLADSTVVILNANSSINYSSDISDIQNREITLLGNAYFKVKKKADHRPFTVHSNSISIAVLGTEFNVNARSKATEIVLTTGKVKVSYFNINTSAVYMNPGEKVQLDTLHNTLIKSETNTSLYSAWTDDKWNFSSTSLLEIAHLIHEYYGIETVFTNEKIKRSKITAVIPVTDLNSFTNILAKTLNLKITEHHDQLHIQF
jgi:transmembrane sensor